MSDVIGNNQRMSYWLFEAHEPGGNPWPIEIPEGEGVPILHLLGDGTWLDLLDIPTGRRYIQRLIERRDEEVNFEVPVPATVAVDLDVFEVNYPIAGPLGENYGTGRIIKPTTNAGAFEAAYDNRYWWNPDSSGYLHRYDIPDNVRDGYEVSDPEVIFPVNYTVRVYVPVDPTMVPIDGTWGELLGLSLHDVEYPVERHYADGSVVPESEKVPGRLAILAGKSWSYNGTYYKPTSEGLIITLISLHGPRGAGLAGPWNYDNGARLEETDPGPPPVFELVWPSDWPQSPPVGWDPVDWEAWLPFPWTDWGIDGSYAAIARPYPWWNGTGPVPTEWPYDADPVLLHGPPHPLTYRMCILVERLQRGFRVSIGVVNLTPVGGAAETYDFEWDPGTGVATPALDTHQAEELDYALYIESNTYDSNNWHSNVQPTEGAKQPWPDGDIPTVSEFEYWEGEVLEIARYFVAVGDLVLHFDAILSDEENPDEGIGGFHDDRFVDPDIGQARGAILAYLAGGTKRIYDGTLGVLPRPLSGATETFMGRTITADTHYTLDVILGPDGPLAVKVQDGNVQVWDAAGELLWNDTLENSLPPAVFEYVDGEEPRLEYRFAQPTWPHPTGELRLGDERLLISARSKADAKYITPGGQPPVIFQDAFGLGAPYVVYPDPGATPYPRIVSSSETGVPTAWGGAAPFDPIDPGPLTAGMMPPGLITVEFDKILTLPETAEEFLAERARYIYLYSRAELSEENVYAGGYSAEFYTPYAGAIEALRGWNVAVLTAESVYPGDPVEIEVGVSVGLAIALVDTEEL